MKRFSVTTLFLLSLLVSVPSFAADKLPLVITDGFSRQLPTADDLLIHDRLVATATLILEPGGTSALQGDLAGNARGADATDWQRLRSAVTMVASGAASSICGGEDNTIASSSTHAFLGGGETNTLTGGNHSVIVGGNLNNVNSCVNGTIAGGRDNELLVSSNFAFIGGGTQHQISTSSFQAVICGGLLNTITSSPDSFIGGGDGNDISSTGTESVIVGGLDNEIEDCLQAAIGGGELNTITNSSDSGVIAGGQQNDVTTSLYATVGGGINNNITGSQRSTIGGGENHDINTAQHATICGGNNNNLTSADYAFMAGGLNNTTSSGADYSFCTGRSNEVGAIYSEAHGLEAATTLRGENAQASGHFATAGDAQTAVMTVRRSTSDGVERTLFLNGDSATEGMTVPANSCWTFSALVVAQQDTGANGAGYEIKGVIRRDGGGAATLVGSITKTVLGEDVAAWDATIVASTNDLQIRVTGAAATNINWVARVEITQVTVAN